MTCRIRISSLNHYGVTIIAAVEAADESVAKADRDRSALAAANDEHRNGHPRGAAAAERAAAAEKAYTKACSARVVLALAARRDGGERALERAAPALGGGMCPQRLEVGSS